MQQIHKTEISFFAQNKLHFLLNRQPVVDRSTQQQRFVRYLFSVLCVILINRKLLLVFRLNSCSLCVKSSLVKDEKSFCIALDRWSTTFLQPGTGLNYFTSTRAYSMMVVIFQQLKRSYRFETSDKCA